MAIQSGVTVTDNGSLSFGTGDALSMYGSYGSTQQIVVGNGGLLTITGTTITTSNMNGATHLITVNAGGHMQASNSTFSLNTVTLASGSVDTIQYSVFATQLAISSGVVIGITANDFSNGTVVASGDPNATINLVNNYWGTTNTSQIAAKITDRNSSPINTRPLVLYSPVLSAAAQPSTTTVTSSTGGSSVYGQSVTFTATVSAGFGHVRQRRHGDVQRRQHGAGHGEPEQQPGDVHYGDTTVERHAHDHGQLQRRHELCDQQRQRAANGDHGEHDHDGDLIDHSVGVWPERDVHGDSVVSGQWSVVSGRRGTVTFSDGSTSLGTASLSSGTATYSAPATVIDTVTTHTITASYSGDTNFSGSSNSVLQTVSTASTSTTVSSSSNASVFGQSVTFTATAVVSGRWSAVSGRRAR